MLEIEIKFDWWIVSHIEKRNTRFRLTLVLSCAMKFESYPHDTQICSMMIESRKYIINNSNVNCNIIIFLIVNLLEKRTYDIYDTFSYWDIYPYNYN